MLCAFDFDGTLADSKMAYYTALKRYAEKHTFPLPSQYEMDMAFGNPHPPFFLKIGGYKKIFSSTWIRCS